jgi:hypothetical protein
MSSIKFAIASNSFNVAVSGSDYEIFKNGVFFGLVKTCLSHRKATCVAPDGVILVEKNRYLSEQLKVTFNSMLALGKLEFTIPQMATFGDRYTDSYYNTVRYGRVHDVHGRDTVKFQGKAYEVVGHGVKGDAATIWANARVEVTEVPVVKGPSPKQMRAAIRARMAKMGTVSKFFQFSLSSI